MVNYEAMLHLYEQGLVSMKTTEVEGNLYDIFKYKNKVFYKNLWNQNDNLMESRGIVFEHGTGRIVQLPIRKVFNFGENKTFVNRDKMVIAERKVNGFMLSVTRENGKLFFSTTGSLDSDFVTMGRIAFNRFVDGRYILSNYTYTFEICLPEQDPHIIHEDEGVYLLQVRDKITGRMVGPHHIDQIANDMGTKFAESFMTRMGTLMDRLKVCEHEGFVVRDPNSMELLVKLKSPHYLSKKLIMRLGKTRVDTMFDDPELFKENVDEEFYDIVDYITLKYSCDEWKGMSDQERRKEIEHFFGYYGG